jgi:hypothetical protein
MGGVERVCALGGDLRARRWCLRTSFDTSVSWLEE